MTITKRRLPKMRIEKYAAIDIGSNAIRMLIANVIHTKETNIFQKSSLVRVPVRLGEDSFIKGVISDYNIHRVTDVMKAFKLLMGVHGVKSYLAYATSALRDAANGNNLVEKVAREAMINIEIINGEKEAAIISNTHVFDFVDIQKTFLYVDVGGGSTELSILKNGNRIHSKSFRIGTVRLLNEGVSSNTWKEVEDWVKEHTLAYEKIYLLGSGGNINKVHKISGLKEGKPISFLKLNAMYEEMAAMTYEERVVKLRLNLDRSDVILPALEIFLKIFKWSGANVVYVPKIGLSDGMIKEMVRVNN